MKRPEYRDFKTGLSYRDVYHIIWNRPHKTRHAVLGHWREIKLAMWDEFNRRMDELEAANDNAKGETQ